MWTRAAVFVFSLVTVPLSAQTWTATASQHRGTDARFVYDCPANGEPSAIWGTDQYTDDSSVCTAAVHAGLITLRSGGSVTILMSGPANSFEASTRNGITSRSYPAWGGSFRFVDGSATSHSPASVAATWAMTMSRYRNDLGRHIRITCPAGGRAFAVWGDGAYTSDSSACTAAVHAGAISLADGGTFTVEITGRHESYEAVTRNGIASRSWGPWNASFRVLE